MKGLCPSQIWLTFKFGRVSGLMPPPRGAAGCNEISPTGGGRLSLAVPSRIARKDAADSPAGCATSMSTLLGGVRGDGTGSSWRQEL
jgi:hypothetical protein